MSRTIETTVYQFSELSDKAKENARNWFRGCMDSSDYADQVIDDAATMGEILGIVFDTHPVRLMSGATRNDYSVHWSGFSSQGDGACFDGTYCYAKGASAEIRKAAPLDGELHRIADALRDAQRGFFYKLRADCRHVSRYMHSGSMDVTVEHGDDSYRDIGDSEEAIRDALRSFADWIYRQLEKEYEYQSSNEAIDEAMLANEYEFDSEGDIA